MTFEELAEHLVRAAYIASGHDLPAPESPYLLCRYRHRQIVAAVLRALADHRVYEPAGHHLRALADEVINP